MIIDANLILKEHVDELLVMISKQIGVLAQENKKYLPVDVANNVYKSLVFKTVVKTTPTE